MPQLPRLPLAAAAAPGFQIPLRPGVTHPLLSGGLVARGAEDEAAAAATNASSSITEMMLDSLWQPDRRR